MRHTSSKLNRYELGNRISTLRGGTSQEAFAEKLSEKVQYEVNRRTVSRWENGATEISLSSLTELADYFNVSLDYITGQIDFIHVGNDEIINSTGLSEKSVETLRKWQKDSQPRILKDKKGNPLILKDENGEPRRDENGEKMKETAPFSDGLAVIRLKMLNFLLENENIGLLDTLYNCIFGKFLDDNKYVKLDSGATVIGATNRTLQNAFIPALTVCIEDLRDIAERGQTKTAQRLIRKRHDALARKDSR